MLDENLSKLWLLIVLACITAGFYRIRSMKSAYPLPPGPPISWFGLKKNGVKVPQIHPWLTYAKWQEKYGDLIYLNVFKNPILVVGSLEASHELLNKRSAIYSSRPAKTMQSELLGLDWVFASMPYGPWYKKHRSMFHTHFQQKLLPTYYDLQIKHTHVLLRNLLRPANTLEYYIRRTAAAAVLEVCYGHHVAEQGDEYIALANNAIPGIVKSGNFGTYMVDYLPILKYVPEWMPGAQFKRDAREWRHFSQQLIDFPYNMVKEKLENGTAEPCFVTTELENWFRNGAKNDTNQEALIKGSSATAFAAGSDTTMSAIVTFFLAMGLYPEIQERARADVDRVVPKDRMPQFSDRERLPFIDCIIWECLRWNSPVDMTGHYCMEDDIYEGYRIPKGTTVFANMWSIFHNPTHYPEPMKFNPDRFVDPEKNAANNINPVPEMSFGTCPGRAFALDTVWMVITSVLAVYKISKGVDEFGREVEPEIEYSSGLVSHAKPFKYQIKPRSAEAQALIEQTAGKA